jgi:hypothetical protein
VKFFNRKKVLFSDANPPDTPKSRYYGIVHNDELNDAQPAPVTTRGYVLALHFKFHQELEWTKVCADLLKWFKTPEVRMKYHIIMDARYLFFFPFFFPLISFHHILYFLMLRFSTKALFDYLVSLGFLVSIAFKANVEQSLWRVLGYQLAFGHWRAAQLPNGAIASCFSTGNASRPTWQLLTNAYTYDESS